MSGPLLVLASPGWGTLLLAFFAGIALMLVFDVNWRDLPRRLTALAMIGRRNAGWGLLAVGSLGVLVFY
jgi:hypothetical protein